MIITINTKEDSKDEIRKIISMLQNLLNEPGIVDSSASGLPSSPGIFGLFDNPAPATNDSSSQQSPVFPETAKEEKEDDIMDHIEIYEY